MKYILLVIGLVIFVYALRLGELATQPARYAAYWQRGNQLAPTSDQILYIALGDSTAQGIGANKPANSYVGYIARELENRSGKPVRLINLSKTGAKLDHALNNQLPRLSDYQINQNTVLTIEIGANDMSDFQPEKFENDMNKLMSRLPKQAIISDIPYFGGGLNRSSEPKVSKANQIMYRLAKKHGFQLAKLHEGTQNDSGPRTFAADWFHPSTYSYKNIWAPAFLEQISKTRK